MSVFRSVIFCFVIMAVTCAASKKCSSNCICFEDEDGNLAAKCNIQENARVALPEYVTKLDLSNNSLSEIPNKVFKFLPYLSHLILSKNRIKQIEENTFKNLTHLSAIDLSNNDLKHWKVDAQNELSQLRYINLQDNTFVPGQQLLKLPMLLLVEGVSWSERCQNCALVKTDFIKNITESTSIDLCELKPEDFQWYNEVQYGLSFRFAQYGFSAQCFCASQWCASADKNIPYNLELNLLIRKMFYIEYFLGTIAVIANLIVTLTITLSRNLHKPSFVLICNMALCDILMGVYSVLIGRFTVYEFIVNKDHYPNMDTFVNDYCSAMGFIFSTSQLVAVPTSLLMTVERFLSIVYCMNPARRLRIKRCFIICGLVWCGALSYATLPLFRVGNLRYHGEYQCMLPFVNGQSHTNVSESTLVIAILLAVVYLITIALYIPIYRYVKNASVSVGVKRKATLARNIAIMITTNFTFSLAPLISTLIFVYCYFSFANLLNINTLKKLQTYFIFLSWLPVVLLSVNCCLNPFLCAFRHPQFQAQIRLALKRIKKQKPYEDVTRQVVRTPGTQLLNSPMLTLPDISQRNNLKLGVKNCTFDEHQSQQSL